MIILHSIWDDCSGLFRVEEQNESPTERKLMQIALKTVTGATLTIT
jgi:hypothetical protein